MVPFTQDPNLLLPSEGRFYIVNTNTRHNSECQENMLTHQKVAAYTEPWNGKIEKLQPGDIVFLYQTERGIIAMGTASGETMRNPANGLQGEYSQKLKNFISFVDKPIPANEVKSIVGTNMTFRQTLFALDEDAGKLLKEHIQSTRVSLSV